VRFGHCSTAFASLNLAGLAVQTASYVEHRIPGAEHRDLGMPALAWIIATRVAWCCSFLQKNRKFMRLRP
jgi:hypothetical protein